MKIWKKLLPALLAVCLIAGMLTGCSGKRDQFAEPKAGDQVATIKIKDFGEIKFVLFPDVAPKGVENFVTLAEQGYYDGVIFHRVIDGFMIQGGDPTGTGSGGESIWGSGFGLETDDAIRHFSGAVAYAHSSLPDSNGSQFYIVNGAFNYTLEEVQAINQQYVAAGMAAPLPEDEAVIKQYVENGGAPSLDGEYTVFGQVYKGMDVVQAIMNVEVAAQESTGEESRPVEDIVIESVTIETVE